MGIRNQPRRPTFTDRLDRLSPARQVSLVSRPYSFFRTISCNMWRSNERSATNRFSFVFSSGNCRNSRSSLSPRPASLRFQV